MMSPAAFAMLMDAAKEQFHAAFKAEDLEAIEASLGHMSRLHRAYFGYDAFGDSATPASPRTAKAGSN